MRGVGEEKNPGIEQIRKFYEFSSISDILASIFSDMGVSLNGGAPKTPQNDHF